MEQVTKYQPVQSIVPDKGLFCSYVEPPVALPVHVLQSVLLAGGPTGVSYGDKSVTDGLTVMNLQQELSLQPLLPRDSTLYAVVCGSFTYNSYHPTSNLL